MRTFELIIVFSALMAIIALVTIGIDWIGRPLRNRRFIERMYRYDDEILEDPYAVPRPVSMASTGPAPAIDMSPPAQIPLQWMPIEEAAPALGTVAAAPVAELSAGSAFSKAILHSSSSGTKRVAEVAASTRAFASRTPRNVSHQSVSTSGAPEPTSGNWNPGMALDARVGDRRPTPAIKAERFWKSAALSMNPSHFDDNDRARMAAGKAPRRQNPRTGRLESAQLVGLRQASVESDVRMRWPDDSVDPWSSG